MTPANHAKVRASFEQQEMMRTLGACLDQVSEGVVVISAPLSKHTSQQHGFGHAGLTFSIGDSAAGYAALSVMPIASEVLTVEMKINLLAPAKGERLRATGKVLKAGRRLVVVAADVHAIENGNETLIAVLQGTMIPIDVGS